MGKNRPLCPTCRHYHAAHEESPESCDEKPHSLWFDSMFFCDQYERESGADDE